MGDTDSQRKTVLSVIAANDRRILKVPTEPSHQRTSSEQISHLDSQPMWVADNHRLPPRTHRLPPRRISTAILKSLRLKRLTFGFTLAWKTFLSASVDHEY